MVTMIELYDSAGKVISDRISSANLSPMVVIREDGSKLVAANRTELE
jgi:hypothetical protein